MPNHLDSADEILHVNVLVRLMILRCVMSDADLDAGYALTLAQDVHGSGAWCHAVHDCFVAVDAGHTIQNRLHNRIMYISLGWHTAVTPFNIHVLEALFAKMAAQPLQNFIKVLVRNELEVEFGARVCWQNGL